MMKTWREKDDTNQLNGSNSYLKAQCSAGCSLLQQTWGCHSSFPSLPLVICGVEAVRVLLEFLEHTSWGPTELHKTVCPKLQSNKAKSEEKQTIVSAEVDHMHTWECHRIKPRCLKFDYDLWFLLSWSCLWNPRCQQNNLIVRCKSRTSPGFCPQQCRSCLVALWFQPSTLLGAMVRSGGMHSLWADLNISVLHWMVTSPDSDQMHSLVSLLRHSLDGLLPPSFLVLSHINDQRCHCR